MQQLETQPTNEAELVGRAQAGDRDAFAELVLAHQRFVYNLALRGVGDPHEAEDLAQEAFLRAWLALPRFRRAAKFRTWLYSIVVNLCYNRLPRLRRELAALPVDTIEVVPQERLVGPEESFQAGEQRTFLHSQIERLPDSYRMILLLRYQQELSYDEIAEIMDIPLGTVKTGLHRARQQLRQALREYEEVYA